MTTLDLFVKPFPNPAGGEWKPLVERVIELNTWADVPNAWEAAEALLIVAAHRWAASQSNRPWRAREYLCWYGEDGDIDDLVLACHLIADAIHSASASSSSSSSSSSSGGNVSGN